MVGIQFDMYQYYSIGFGISTTALVFFFPGNQYIRSCCIRKDLSRVCFADLLNFSKNPQAPKGMEISLAMVAMVAGKCCSTRWVEGEVAWVVGGFLQILVYTLTW